MERVWHVGPGRGRPRFAAGGRRRLAGSVSQRWPVVAKLGEVVKSLQFQASGGAGAPDREKPSRPRIQLLRQPANLPGSWLGSHPAPPRASGARLTTQRRRRRLIHVDLPGQGTARMRMEAAGRGEMMTWLCCSASRVRAAQRTSARRRRPDRRTGWHRTRSWSPYVSQ